MKIQYLNDTAGYSIIWIPGQSYFQKFNSNGEEFEGFTEYSNEGEGQPPSIDEAYYIAEYDFEGARNEKA